MIKKTLMCLVWFIVIYFVLCSLVGGVAGAIAGGKDPQNASRAGGVAGEAAVKSLILYIVVGSVTLAGAGTYFEVLPGTKSKQ